MSSEQHKGTFKYGKFGRYYVYIDPKTKKVYNIGAKAKALTEEHLDNMIDGKIVTIESKTLFGKKRIQTKLIPYTSKNGNETFIINYKDLDEIDDRVTMKQNKNKIVPDKVTDTKYEYKKHVLSVLNSLNLCKDVDKTYKVYTDIIKSPLSDDKKTDSYIYDSLIIYRNYNGNDGLHDADLQAFTVCYRNEPDGTRKEEITKEEYLKKYLQFRQEQTQLDEEKKAKEKACDELRRDIYNQYLKDGKELVDSINIDDVLDLSNFKKLQKLLVQITDTSEAVQYICENAYPEIDDLDTLKHNLLHMIKLHIEFNDMDKKSITSIAKFIATHNLVDYYDKILEFDEALEPLIKNTNDGDLLKRALTQVANNSYMDKSFLANSSFYFEKTLRPKNIVHNPLKIIDDLKELIPTFNERSNVAVLSNIVLNADESFTYQFYTFSKDSNGEDYDGRRLKHLTALYNKCHPINIYFTYDDGDEDEDEQEKE